MAPLTKAHAKELVDAFCERFRPSLALAVHYGSSSPASSQPLKEGSDVDVMAITWTMEQAVHVLAAGRGPFEAAGVGVDLHVGPADLILGQLQARQNVLLYRGILEHGHTVLADPAFEQRLRPLLATEDLPQILRATLARQWSEGAALLRTFLNCVPVSCALEVLRARLVQRNPGQPLEHGEGVAEAALAQGVADAQVIHAWERLRRLAKDLDPRPGAMPRLEGFQADYALVAAFVDEAAAQAAAAPMPVQPQAA